MKKPQAKVSLSLLKKFCFASHSESLCRAPFSWGMYSYASNGQIAIRVDRLSAIPEAESPGGILRLPWWTAMEGPNQWVDLPPFPEPPEDKIDFWRCSKCAGLGHLKRCENCSGIGLVLGADLKRHRCPICRNHKKLPSETGDECPECKGKGGKHERRWQNPSMQIGSKRFLVCYIELISLLPKVQVAPDATKQGEAMPFDFVGGEGLLMPLRVN